MKEDQDILFAKAISRTLEGAEIERWEALCAAEPELLREFEEASQVAAELRKKVEAMDSGSESPATIPEEVYQRLEADRIAHLEEGNSADTESDKVVSFFSGLRNQAGLLAVAAAIAVAALGWWVWKGPSGRPVVATVKALIVSEDLPMATPGALTHLTDPPITWISLDPRPVKVSILSSDGKSVLFSAEADRSPIKWKDLQPVGSANLSQFLLPERTYLFRLQQGSVTTEKIVSLSRDARALAEWGGETPEELRTRFEQWMDEGYGADVLALASHLARTSKANGLNFNETRNEALREALSAEKKRMIEEKSGN